MLAEIIQTIGIDKTLAIQFGLFILFFLWMKAIFFGPFAKLLEDRHAKTHGMKDGAGELEQAAEQKEAEYAARAQQLKREASAEQEKIISAARKQAAEILDQARKSAKASIDQARVGADVEAQNTIKELGGGVSSLAGMFVEKLTKERVKL